MEVEVLDSLPFQLLLWIRRLRDKKCTYTNILSRMKTTNIDDANFLSYVYMHTGEEVSLFQPLIRSSFRRRNSFAIASAAASMLPCCP